MIKTRIASGAATWRPSGPRLHRLHHMRAAQTHRSPDAAACAPAIP
jgi:hypothetical protein